MSAYQSAASHGGGRKSRLFANGLFAVFSFLFLRDVQAGSLDAALETIDGRLRALEQGADSEDSRPEQSSPVTISGVVEVEGGYSRDYTGEDSSDLVVATVELGAGVTINDWTGAEVILLYEEDGDGIDVDVATVAFANPDVTPFYATAGRLYVPFGRFDTAMVSDPLTLELAETGETALQAGYVGGLWQGAVYVFNGNVNRTPGSDHVGQWGGSLAATIQGVELGVDYISNIGDSDALQDTVTDPDDVDDYTPAVAVHAGLSHGSWTLAGEYITATDSFAATDLAFGGNGARPGAWNLELDYEYVIGSRVSVVGVAVQQTKDALALELPRERYLVSWSLSLLESTALSLEWLHDRDYGTVHGGTGKHGNTLTAQLAVEF